MASFDSVIFLTLLVAISAFMAVPSAVEAGRDGDDIVNVTGTVPCAVTPRYFRNGSLMGNTFPNATVQLRCGKNDTTVATNTTNANGTFSIVLQPPRDAVLVYLRTSINCTAVVITPLSTCNSTLPTNGTLRSALKLGPIDRVDDIKVYTLVAKEFRFENRTI